MKKPLTKDELFIIDILSSSNDFSSRVGLRLYLEGIAEERILLERAIKRHKE